MKTVGREKNGGEFEIQLSNAYKNNLSIKVRRILDLEKEVDNLKDIHKLEILELQKKFFDMRKKWVDGESLIVELLSYKNGLEKENREILKNQIPKHLREIDSEILTNLK